MARMKLNQITIEPISLTTLQNYAYFFSGLPAQLKEKDIANMLGVTEDTVKRWLKSGELAKINITSVKAFISSRKSKSVRTTYATRMTIFAAFINEAAKDLFGTLAFSISLVNTVNQLNSLRELSKPSDLEIPTEDSVYKKLLSIYHVHDIQFPYELVKEYAEQSTDPNKIFVTAKLQESVIDVVKNGGKPIVHYVGASRKPITRRVGTTLVSTLCIQCFNDGEVIIKYAVGAIHPTDEETRYDKKHKNLEVDDG